MGTLTLILSALATIAFLRAAWQALHELEQENDTINLEGDEQ